MYNNRINALPGSHNTNRTLYMMISTRLNLLLYFTHAMIANTHAATAAATQNYTEARLYKVSYCSLKIPITL